MVKKRSTKSTQATKPPAKPKTGEAKAVATVLVEESVEESPAITLQLNHHIDWKRLGLRHHDLVGWPFSILTPTGPEHSVEPYEQIGIVIHAPIDLTVVNQTLHWPPPLQVGSYEIRKKWEECILWDGRKLTFQLPLSTLPGRTFLILPPPELTDTPEAAPLDVMTTCHNDKNPSLTVVIQLPVGDSVLKQGTPIAHIVPIHDELEQPLPPLAPPQPQAIDDSAPDHQQGPPQDRPDETPLPIKEFAPPEFCMRIWRIHPQGARIERAEKTLRGDAPVGATKFCGPFNHANAYGFWVYPPCDLDIIWHGGRSFDYKIINDFSDDDIQHMKTIERPSDRFIYSRQKRTRLDFGIVHENLVTIWTGCVFQTPPGWGLMIRNPINVKGETIFRIQEGILETDWLSYDIWMNLEFIQQNKWVHIRRDKPWAPIAQLIPVPRIAYDERWYFENRMMERNTPEGENLYQRWTDYNYKKWLASKQKDPTTYHKQRARSLSMLTPENAFNDDTT